MADVQTTALIMDGSTFIPAAWKAMTKGEEEAVPVEVERASLVYGLRTFVSGVQLDLPRWTYTIMPTIKILST
jgi:hypothetical protein